MDLEPKNSMGTKSNTKNFIKKSKKIHGDKYNYNKTEYTYSKNKVKIICETHGPFEQQASAHLSGHGCYKCGREETSKKNQKWNEQNFKDKCQEIHPNLIFSNTVFKKHGKKVSYICPSHGEQETYPRTVLSGHGCRKCHYSKMTLNLEDTIKECNSVHDNKYDYRKVKGQPTLKSKIKIVCPNHGIFKQSLGKHRKGNGCPKCAIFGFSKTDWVEICIGEGMLYIVNLYNENESFYKVGITSKTVKDRLKHCPYDVNICAKFKEKPETIWNIEKEVHSIFSDNRYTPDVIFSGYRECYPNFIPILKYIETNFNLVNTTN